MAEAAPATPATPAPPAAPAADPAAAPAAPAANWYDGFADVDVKNFAINKQWKDPMEAVRSGMNLEKLIGVPAEQIVKLPKADDADAWNKVYDRLGRPAKAEDYKLPALEGDDGAFAKEAAAWMHKAGLTTAQAQTLAKLNNEHIANIQAQALEATAAKRAAETAALKTEWGAAFDKNTQMVDRAARELGLEESTVKALGEVMGPAGAMRFLHSLGEKIGEDRYVSGNGNPGFNGVMAPAQAQAQLAMLKADPAFVTKYVNGDAEARMRMEHLHKMAYPEPS